MADELTERYRDLLQGSYDCVDRIVLNAYSTLCYSAGGFRQWWRRLMDGSGEHLDNAHLMRMAGRFSRRVRGFAKAHNIPVIDCRRGERKHDVAEEFLAARKGGPAWSHPEPGASAPGRERPGVRGRPG
jgi:hypothetical protein